MSDYISRADAIEALEKVHNDAKVWEVKCGVSEALHALEALPSADANPTVIRAKTFMRKEDFDKWAEDIKRQNKSIVCIPCDAEVVSADAEPKWNCTANFVAEQLDRLRKMTDEEKWEFFRKFFGMGDAVQGEWIPCSERLPDEGQGVIVTVDDNVYKIKVGSCIYSNGRFHSLYNDLTVTAWMPLPTPYKESEVEE